MGFVVKRGENYSARLAIPKALRPILGRNEFKKSLGTTSKKEAELLAAPLVLRWKKLIEETKTFHQTTIRNSNVIIEMLGDKNLREYSTVDAGKVRDVWMQANFFSHIIVYGFRNTIRD
jgi:hypothetical protein